MCFVSRVRGVSWRGGGLNEIPASSRLDPLTEQLIEQAVDRLLQNRTGIVIAHRLKTVERVDQILILDNGQQVEYSDRSSLLQDLDSRFLSLLQTSEVGLR